MIFGGSGRLILARFTTDAQGRFDLTAEVPARLPGRYWIDAVVERPIGGWQASKTLSFSARIGGDDLSGLMARFSPSLSRSPSPSSVRRT